MPSFQFLGPRNIKIIAFFCQGSTAGKDILEEILVQGNICQTNPFQTTLLRTPPYTGDKEPISNLNNVFGIVLGMGGGQMCLCVALFLGEK